MQIMRASTNLRPYYTIVLAALFTSAATKATELEVIKVTSQYFEQNLQQVPVSATVISFEALEQQRIIDQYDIALATPGMSYAEFAPGQSLTSIRGIISADDGAGMDNSVAVFLDGVYIGRQANINFDLLDLSRVEVLRGPQGTLFGRNTIGGAISLTSELPQFSQTNLIKTSFGNYQNQQLKAVVNRELSDSIAARVSYNYRAHDGYVHNALLNTQQQDLTSHAIRAQLLFDNSNGHWLLTADYSADDRADMGRFPYQNGNFDYIQVWQDLGGKTGVSTSPIDGFSKRDNMGISLSNKHKLWGGQLQSIFAYRQASTDWEMASVGAPLGGNYDLSAGNLGLDVNDDILEDIQQHSAELRWLSTPSENFKYVVGLYYLNEQTERVEQFKLDNNSTTNGQQTVGNEVADQHNTTKSYASYIQSEWAIDKRWNLVTGIRYTKDNKQTQSTSLNCGQQENALVNNNPLCDVGNASLSIMQKSFQATGQHSWNNLSPKIALQYLSDSSMIYISISKGFKSGGFAGAPGVESVATTPIKPETATSYELGHKLQIADKLRLNTSLFYTDYQNLQITRFGPSPQDSDFGTFLTTNIDQSVISGVELEANWIINNHFELSGHYAYLDSEIKAFKLAAFAGEVDLTGSELRQSPKHSANVIAHYQFALSEGRGHLDGHISWQFIDEQISDYLNQNTIIDQQKYWNANVTWHSANNNWQISFWGKNLTNNRYVSHSYVIGPGIIGIWSPPRRYGLTLSWGF
ncbi:TonB-dependent receptor [Catenovulum agarivorans DS-2]|uniref:TonB-dependent receptor n=1 Tax=Catenovulum agarivorans DS-2 TaxID=1328313 RepID=W7QU08_9ALTE|nr:TonB-dependent receptor [Catenovulum agarivorans]EWH08930.1 TonB-dependent receptor [Catenovulum agarivorans DS-2]